MADFLIRVHVPDTDLAAGWADNRTEYLRSVEAALYEVQGDDGGAYRALVTWPDENVLMDIIRTFRKKVAKVQKRYRDAQRAAEKYSDPGGYERAEESSDALGQWLIGEAMPALITELERGGKTEGVCTYCGTADSSADPLIVGPDGGPMCWNSDRCMTRIEG